MKQKFTEFGMKSVFAQQKFWGKKASRINLIQKSVKGEKNPLSQPPPSSRNHANQKREEEERESEGIGYQESVAYSESFPLEEKIINPTSASQSTEIS